MSFGTDSNKKNIGKAKENKNGIFSYMSLCGISLNEILIYLLKKKKEKKSNLGKMYFHNLFLRKNDANLSQSRGC